MQSIDSVDTASTYAPAFDSNHSGVSWSAVLAGAAAATILTLVLFILGFGLGLSALSPWRSLDGAVFGWSAIAWVTFTQIAAAGLGGYLAGRLRVKWARLHGDEVYFRDTAHGFLAWAIASLLMFAVFGSAISALVSGGAKAGSAAAGTAFAAAAPMAAATAHANENTNNANSAGAIDYYIDNLFRNEQMPTDPATNAADRREVAHIFMHTLSTGDLSAEDKNYLGQIIARRTGMSAADANARVTTIYDQTRAAIEQAKAKAQDAADKARKTAAYTSLWLFVALLAGAFFASICATWGGKQRDAFAPV